MCFNHEAAPLSFQRVRPTGPLVSILDGDTLEVLHHHHLNVSASALAFGKEVTLHTHGYDKYKRTIGEVILPDGMNLNQDLVKQGWCWWCWWYRKYAPGDTVLEGVETEARESRIGL
jgi:micrococcal nuclease